MRRSDKCYLALGLILIASELYKQYLLTFQIGGGRYDWWYFPFQLCSLPLYLLPVYALLRPGRAKEAILTFLSTYNLVGGTLVFFDVSGMFYPLTVLTVHSFLWHFALIGIGLYSGYLLRKKGAVNGKNFRNSTLLYLCFCGIAELINRLVTPRGVINLFYINPAQPMEQILFREIASSLGNTAAILSYIAGTVLISYLLFLLWRAAPIRRYSGIPGSQPEN